MEQNDKIVKQFKELGIEIVDQASIEDLDYFNDYNILIPPMKQIKKKARSKKLFATNILNIIKSKQKRSPGMNWVGQSTPFSQDSSK